MRALAAIVVAFALGLALPASSHAPAIASPSCQVRRRRTPRLPRVTAAERRQIVRRHTRATTTEVRRWAALTPPPLVLHVGGVVTPFTMTPTDPSTFAFDDAALATMQEALACRDGTTHAIHPRLVSLLYETVTHFRTPFVNVVSGYRSGNPSSRHGQGRAIDFALPGVTDTRLSVWLRTRGFVGVGIYPTSGFVHLDVRARSYFWRDVSGPRERNRERQILSALGPREDREARARGMEPVPELTEISEHEGEGGESATVCETPEASEAGVPADAGVPP